MDPYDCYSGCVFDEEGGCFQDVDNEADASNPFGDTWDEGSEGDDD